MDYVNFITGANSWRHETIANTSYLELFPFPWVVCVLLLPTGHTRMHSPAHLPEAQACLSVTEGGSNHISSQFSFSFGASIAVLELSTHNAHDSRHNVQPLTHNFSAIMGSGSSCMLVITELNRILGPYSGVRTRLFKPNSPKPALTAACL